MKRCGTPYMYQLGCRCEPCRAAARVKNAENRAHRKSGAPPRRNPRQPLFSHPIQLTHGTEHAYTTFGCRCATCRRAGSDGRMSRRAAKRQRQPRGWQGPIQLVHGKGYRLGCRCLKCALAESRRKRAWQARRQLSEPRTVPRETEECAA